MTKCKGCKAYIIKNNEKDKYAMFHQAEIFYYVDILKATYFENKEIAENFKNKMLEFEEDKTNLTITKVKLKEKSDLEINGFSFLPTRTAYTLKHIKNNTYLSIINGYRLVGRDLLQATFYYSKNLCENIKKTFTKPQELKTVKIEIKVY